VSNAIVCDASVLASIIFYDHNCDQARALTRSRRLLASRILRYEMAQVAVRKALCTPDDSVSQVLKAFEASLRVPVRLVDPDWPNVVRLALAHGLSAYDASYLQVALSLRLPLATLDKRLARVAEKLGLLAEPAALRLPATSA
jgi:predicted nucleic acid-binding protein